MTIKEMREACNMSITDFAKLLEIPYRTVQDWEGGRRKPPEYVIKLIEYKLINEIIIKGNDEI